MIVVTGRVQVPDVNRERFLHEVAGTRRLDPARGLVAVE